MATIFFKRLFEIRLLHDYYLTAEDGNSYFLKTAAEQHAFLDQKMQYSQYDIRKDMLIKPTADARRKMERNKLRLVNTPLGLVVGGEVKVLEQADGSIHYEPRFGLDEDLSLNFEVHAVNSLWGTITQTRVRADHSGKYYWTNANAIALENGADTFLPLATPVPNFEAGRVYQMGEPSVLGGTLREALEQNVDAPLASIWREKDETRAIHEGDRLLFARHMHYQFDAMAGIFQATFTLKDLSNNVIKTIDKSDLGGGKRAFLNFKTVDETDPNSAEIKEGFYQLQIQASNGFNVTRQILLNDDLHRDAGIGTIDIQLGNTTSDYGLLDANGELKTRIDGNGNKVLHPIFELRMDSRITYWRYHQEGGFGQADVPDGAGYLGLDNDRLTSFQPRRLTHVYTPYGGNGAPLALLPQPSLAPMKIENGKAYSEVWISSSNILIE